MRTVNTPVINQRLEADIADVLEFLYGAKSFHIPSRHPDELFSLAARMGFIDPDGNLTRKGRNLLTRHS